MSLKEELGIPSAAQWVWGEEGEIHIGDMFGGTWCADRYDEETGEYAPEITLEGPANEPESGSDLHDLCLAAAKEEAEQG